MNQQRAFLDIKANAAALDAMAGQGAISGCMKGGWYVMWRYS
jgi:hypothetical protein